MFSFKVLRSSVVMATTRLCSSTSTKYTTLNVSTPQPFVVQVEMSRPKVHNAMNVQMRQELTDCFEKLSTDKDCRSIVLSGDGNSFTSGIDLTEAFSMFQENSDVDVARRAFMFREHLLPFQNTFTVMEKCLKPVIAAIHGGCVGAGVDMVTACDVRMCTDDAIFQVKEVDLGLAADVGTLQRLPKCIGSQSLVRELVYTGRAMRGCEAMSCGLVSRLFTTRGQMMDSAVQLAANIAKKSPVAVQSSKKNLNFSRDHSVADSLEFVAAWNQAMLQSEDITKAVQAIITKQKPIFSKL